MHRRLLDWPRLAVCGLACLGLIPNLAFADPGASPPPANTSPATPPATGGLGFVPPRAIPSSVMKNWPVYTPAAKQAHREGVVMLSVKISAEGSPLDVSVARSSNFPDLDLAAVAAVRNWKFTPATQNGLPTETTVNLPVNFSLKAAEKTQTPPADTDKNKPHATASQPQPKPTHPAAAKPATPKPEAPKPAASAPTSAPTQPTQPPQ